MQKIYVDTTPNDIAAILERRAGALEKLPKNLDAQMTLLVEYVRIKYGIALTRVAKLINENYAYNNTFYITKVRRAGEGANSSFTAAQYLRFMLVFGLSFDDMYETLCSIERGKESEAKEAKKETTAPFLCMEEIKAFAGCSPETKKKLMQIIAEAETGEAGKAAKKYLDQESRPDSE